MRGLGDTSVRGAAGLSGVRCRFVNLLLAQMSMEELREEACDCLFEIINKGMDPVDKTKLVESLCQALHSAGFFSVEQVRLCCSGSRLHGNAPPQSSCAFRRKTWTFWPSSPGW